MALRTWLQTSMSSKDDKQITWGVYTVWPFHDLKSSTLFCFFLLRLFWNSLEVCFGSLSCWTVNQLEVYQRVMHAAAKRCRSSFGSGSHSLMCKSPTLDPAKEPQTITSLHVWQLVSQTRELWPTWRHTKIDAWRFHRPIRPSSGLVKVSSSFQVPFDGVGNCTHWPLWFLSNFSKGKTYTFNDYNGLSVFLWLIAPFLAIVRAIYYLLQYNTLQIMLKRV